MLSESRHLDAAAASASNFVIRDARSEDLKRLGEIERTAGQMFVDAGIFPELDGDTFPADELAELILKGQVWVACLADDIPVAFVIVVVLDEKAHIEEIDVLPGYGRRGIGTMLLQHACRWASEQNFPAVTLSTFRDVPWNAPFYLKHDFRILDPEEFTPAMIRLREIEAAKGLPIDKRVLMKRILS